MWSISCFFNVNLISIYTRGILKNFLFIYWKTVHGWVLICCIELLYKRLLFILVSNNKFSNLYCHQQVRTRWFGQYSLRPVHSSYQISYLMWYNMGNCLCKRKREPKRYFSLKTFQLFLQLFYNGYLSSCVLQCYSTCISEYTY